MLRSLCINELSRLYRDLPIHSTEERLASNFRNPAGLDLQIRSLATCDPSDNHHQKLNPSLDMVRIWEQYGNDPEALTNQIEVIVLKYGIIVENYPSLFTQ